MRKNFIYSVVFFIFVSSHAFCQDKAPSYFEMDDYNHRYPETDTNIDLYLRSWKNSPVYSASVQHGGWIERPYLTPGEPINPPAPGAVLKYIKSYNHGRIDAGSKTQKVSHDNEQVFFYILKGEGRVVGGDKTVEITEGSGVFIPAGMEYQFFNDCTEFSMEAIIVAEEITDDFEPAEEMATGSYHESQPRPGMHWAHIGRGIFQDGRPRFQNPVGFSVVSVDAWDMAQPHMHGPGVEEVWCQVKGDSLLMFGNQLRVQRKGMAFLVPPNFKIPHSSINHTDEPMQWLYMGNRHDPRETRSMEGHNPGWKENIYDKYGIEY